MKRRIFWNMTVLAFFTIIISFGASSFISYKDIYADMQENVKNEAEYISAAVLTSGTEYLEIPFELENPHRVTYIDGSGKVLFDSESSAAQMENHMGRPEIIQAQKEGKGEHERVSETKDTKTYYYALKLSNGNFLRVSGTTSSVFFNLKGSIPYVVIIIFAMIFLSMLTAKGLVKKIVVPVNEINLENPLANDIYEELSPLLVRISKQNAIIAQQLSELRKKQEEFAAITENMTEGLVVLNAKAEVISTNSGALKIFDVTRQQITGKKFLNMYRGAELNDAITKSFAGHYEKAEFGLNRRQYQAQVSPVYDDMTVTGAVILIFDTTELQAAEQLRREFSANVSHELKTPLTSISGYAEIIKDGMVKPSDIPQFAGRIYTEAGRMITLIDDIIKLSRLDEKSISVPRQNIDLAQIAQTVKLSLERQISAKKIDFQIKGEGFSVFGLRSVLEELIYNLCENSVKYNRIGGSVKVELDAGSRTLSVKDTGIGIPKEHQERVFERFYRVDKSHSRDTGGTGLGLSIVKHAAAFHNAKITLQSDVGQGTEIEVVFPEDEQ